MSPTSKNSSNQLSLALPAAVKDERPFTFKRMEAPGFRWRKDNGKLVPYWVAPPEAVAAGYLPERVRLYGTQEEITQRAQQLMVEAMRWLGASEAPKIAHRFDGTVRSIVNLYLTEKHSPFHALKWTTKREYEAGLALLDRLYGGVMIEDISKRELFEWYGKLQEPIGRRGAAKQKAPRSAPKQHVRAGNFRMTLLKMVAKFGCGDYPACDRLRSMLETTKLRGERSRDQFLTAEMVERFCAVANAEGAPSMALAQALQFETAMRQKDVIGEWAPNEVGKVNEPGPLATRKTTWTVGLVWEEHISPDLVMSKPTSKSRFTKSAVVDLKLLPILMRELERIPPASRKGPVIVSEKTGKPYQGKHFSRLWRKLARKAAIPDDHQNRDSRSGAISEGSNASASLDQLRQFATHAHGTTTLIYDRDRLAASTRVSQLRVAHRQKGTG